MIICRSSNAVIRLWNIFEILFISGGELSLVEEPNTQKEAQEERRMVPVRLLNY